MTPGPAAGLDMEHKMWGGRFVGRPSDALARLNNSLSVDQRLWPHDVRASKAWVSALRGAGVLDRQEEAELLGGLDRVGARLADGAASGAADEDIHSLVERLLFEEVGSVAGKLHTGRSRNDQVSTDLRLWCLHALDELDAELTALGGTLAAGAREGIDLVLPGYTHGQQAQPVRWAFVLLAHAWPLLRDRDRLAGACRRVSVLPLGSGALAGSGISVDRDALKEMLGFQAVSDNALDATGDRDFVADMLFAVTMIATHLSRLGGELVMYSSTEYGFIRLADEFSTGSSLMPQKRNPDVFELARGRAPRTLGNLVTMLGTMHGLPAGYSKDLQEDKQQLFDAVDSILTTMRAVRGAVQTMRPVPQRMAAALSDVLFATDLADGMVAHGIPFREAHGIVGRLVAAAETRGVSLRQVEKEVAEEVHPVLPELLEALGSFADSVDRRVTAGGTSAGSVMNQLEALESQFGPAV